MVENGQFWQGQEGEKRYQAVCHDYEQDSFEFERINNGDIFEISVYIVRHYGLGLEIIPAFI